MTLMGYNLCIQQLGLWLLCVLRYACIIHWKNCWDVFVCLAYILEDWCLWAELVEMWGIRKIQAAHLELRKGKDNPPHYLN